MEEAVPSTPEDRVVHIEGKIDREANRDIVVSRKAGGVEFKNMAEIMDAAKLMAVSGPIIPRWLQGNVGGCWAIIMQSIEWGLSPLAVASQSYEVSGVVRYMSQLIHALVEARAPIRQRLRGEYTGEGDTRVCSISGTII